ncbi:unnamed protein product [Mytilus edulis]|uniref:F5/8 type C domain-containing protein n=1 Tax=Mytilus edulis TaxID=6550 RepID=A0A8S3VH87_MYTED|nr:unnamed protein product [Mytilus edulis]
MSSTYEPPEGFHCCNSELAVDGEKSGWVGPDFLCAHTVFSDYQQPWWAVDLQNVYDINLIHIHGRTDCCPNHLVNFDVEVIMPTCTCNRWNNLDEGNTFQCHYQATESQTKITINCPPNTRGRFVRIKRRDMINLVICEIEINGTPLNSLLHRDEADSNADCHMRSGHTKRNCPQGQCVSAMQCNDIDKHPQEKKQVNDAAESKRQIEKDLSKFQTDLKAKQLLEKQVSSSFISVITTFGQFQPR